MLKSILLQWNSWKLGDAFEILDIERLRSQYGKKDLYFLTPMGDIMHILVERGLAGSYYQNYNVEKSQAEEWMKMLAEWKKEHGEE